MYGTLSFLRNSVPSSLGGALYVQEFGQIQLISGAELEFINNTGRYSLFYKFVVLLPGQHAFLMKKLRTACYFHLTILSQQVMEILSVWPENVRFPTVVISTVV